MIFHRCPVPGANLTHHAPSAFVETQAAFAERLARELGPRLGVKTPLKTQLQTDFSEPLVRINTQPLLEHANPATLTSFWDNHAAFYAA